MPPVNSELEIVPVRSRRDLKEFIQLPYRLYRNDPHWIPPLWVERYETLHPKKNPFYGHAEVKLFLARRKGSTVGRISAQIDREYEKFHKERVGHFGFFECENDPIVAQALLHAAEEFHRTHGVPRSLGPFSFSINEESGLLIDGFHEPLMTMMPYNPPYYATLLEGAGYRKAKDLYAWKYSVGEIPKDPAEVAESVAQYPGLKVRTLHPKNLREDLGKVMEIFNSAWSENWGFVPLTEAEIDKVAKDLKLFMDPEGAFLAEVDGRPAAMCIAVPNLYELIDGLKGRLFPFGLFKLLWRIKKKKYKSGRLMLLGVKKEYRGTILGGLSILLYVEIHKRGLQNRYEWGELSWTLEDNKGVNTGIEFMGGKRYKTYRIYEKNL
jgi:hypothetical protein